MTGRQVVVNNDFVAFALESMGCMAADVSCTSNYQDGQFVLFCGPDISVQTGRILAELSVLTISSSERIMNLE
jgi:hypothetical protein